MNELFRLSQRTGRAAVGIVVAVLVVAAIAWHGLAAETTAARAATVTTPITHAIAGGRDSYADVVDVVAPAVVTIRTEGKARMSPTDFQQPDDDFLKRFFGDQFDSRGRRGPRTFRQRALGSGVIVTTA